MQREARLVIARGFLLGAMLALGGPVRAGDLFAPAEYDAVSVRAVPTATVVETEVTSSIAAAWQKGFRIGALYAASVHSNLNTPTVIILPDWEKTPVAEGDAVHLLVDCLLDPISNPPPVRDAGATIRVLPGATVACCAHEGATTPETFRACLAKIEAHLKAEHIAATGPPRYLFYTTTSWIPSWYRISEVQVPIAVGETR